MLKLQVRENQGMSTCLTLIVALRDLKVAERKYLGFHAEDCKRPQSSAIGHAPHPTVIGGKL